MTLFQSHQAGGIGVPLDTCARLFFEALFSAHFFSSLGYLFFPPIEHISHWKVLFHLSLISFPLALFAWIFCFVGSVVTASLLITLPVGLGFGWIVLVGARALARLEVR